MEPSHHTDSTTSGSRLTETVSPIDDLLWRGTEGPAGVGERTSQMPAYHGPQAPTAHHKVAPNVGPTTGCGNQPDKPRLTQKEDRQERPDEKPGRDNPGIEDVESSCLLRCRATDGQGRVAGVWGVRRREPLRLQEVHWKGRRLLHLQRGQGEAARHQRSRP